MKLRVVQHGNARRDLLERAQYIRKNSPQAALKFARSVEATRNEIAPMPGLGEPREVENPDRTGLRSRPISGFDNHRIFDLTFEDRIEVIRVLHTARDHDAILAEFS